MIHRSGRPPLRPSAAGLLLAVAMAGCGGKTPTNPGGGGDDPSLPAAPVLVTPAGGAQLSTDMPTFTVQNARGFNGSSALYTFQVLTRSGAREIASMPVPGGRGTTTAIFTTPLPRGMTLTWKVTANGSTGQVASTVSTFTTPAVDCLSVAGAFGKSVVEFSIPACSLQGNAYNDPDEVLGPPDARRLSAPAAQVFVGSGFLSLGEKGHVTVDMRGCFLDGPGDDLRIYQAVSSEPVTVYVSGSPSGPFVSIGDREPCGVRSGGGIFSNHCQFDLATGEVTEARYVRIEDGEHYPCAAAQTDSEGADIDAVEMLNRKP
jgi:hypothetical protein